MKKQLHYIALCVLAVGTLLSVGCTTEPDALDEDLQEVLLAASDGQGLDFFKLPDDGNYNAIPQDPQNPITHQKVQLGKLLFHETGIALAPKYESSMNTYSCASCHHMQAGFQAGVAQGIAEGGLGFGFQGEKRDKKAHYPDDSLDVQSIRTPSALNIAYQTNVLWNGQFGATHLNVGTESQWTAGTPKETNELGFEGTETQAIAGLKVHRMLIENTFLDTDPTYQNLFSVAFPNEPAQERITRTNAGLAIAAYERTLLANQAPFQKWLNGDTDAMSDQEKQGAILFFDKAGCATSGCHTGPALNSMAFHALGMPDLSGIGVYGVTPEKSEHLGRGGFTQQEEDMFKFKVPQLYNLKNSPFYGHGGTFRNLKDVVDYKNNGESGNIKVPESQLAESFRPIGLTPSEVNAIVAFLDNALYDPNLTRFLPSDLPSGNCFPNNDEVSKIDLGCDF